MEDVERLHKGLIDKECPDCGSNMLTAEDYRVAKRMMWKLNLIAWLTRMITKMYPAAGMGTLTVQIKDGAMRSSFQEEKRP